MPVPFVGPSYKLNTRRADVQRVVNLYVAPNESGSSKTPTMLKSIPGLVQFANAGSVGRGAYEINGRAWVVADNKLKELIAGGTLIDRGTLVGSMGYVSFMSNTTQLVVVDNGHGYVLTLETNSFVEITAPGFPGGSLTDYLDQFAIFAADDGDSFFISALGDGTSVDLLDFASAEASPDHLTGFRVINRQLWLMGSGTGEVWFNTGAGDFPIERNNGAIFPVGCSAKWSIQPYNGTIAWVGADKAGGPGVWMAAGYQAQRISNRAVEQAIAACTDLSNAIAYVQRIEGSIFYCLQMPGVDTTWCFDALTSSWHERAELVDGDYEKHRVYWYFNAFGKSLGLSPDGKVYEWRKDANDNAGDTLVRDRISPHNALPGARRLYFSNFQLDLDVGYDGDVLLRYSNDGGNSWEAWDARSLGGVGAVQTRLTWDRCGSARDRVWHVRCTDAVPFNPVNATVTVA